MRSPVRRRFAVALASIAVAAACVIVVDEPAGKPCHADVDCPNDYHCVARLPDSGLTCEVIYPLIRPSDGGSGVDAGAVTYYYCSDVKPILDSFCALSCHGGPGANDSGQDFRLDYYNPPTPGLPDGAYAVADRIKVRAYDLQNMPPFGSAAPSDQQRLTLALWDLEGAQFCDAGQDAGMVFFSTQVQAIFNTTCAPGCHSGTTPTGGLDLGTGSYARLVGVPSNCDGGVKRVVPNDTANSLLWQKTSGSATVCGAYMPKNAAPLAQSNGAAFQLITRWIQEGAPNN